MKYAKRPFVTRWRYTAFLYCLTVGLILIFTACRPLGMDDTPQPDSPEKTVAALSIENAALSAIITAGPPSTPSPRPTSFPMRPTPTPFIFEPTEVPAHQPADLRITDLEIYEDYLWLSIGSELQVLDISDPTDLRLVDSQAIAAEIADLEVDFPYLYVAAEDGLHILDVSYTANMRELSTLKFSRLLEQVSVGPHYIYATDPGVGFM